MLHLRAADGLARRQPETGEHMPWSEHPSEDEDEDGMETESELQLKEGQEERGIDFSDEPPPREERPSGDDTESEESDSD